MVYRNKKITLIIYFFVLIGFLYFIYNIKEIGWKVFGMCFGVSALIMYIFAVFEYYKVDDTKITYRSRLKNMKFCGKTYVEYILREKDSFKQ